MAHADMLHLCVDAADEAVLEARDAIATEAGCWLFDNVRPADVPGWSVTEIYVGDRLLKVDDDALMPFFDRLSGLLKSS